MGHEKYSEYFEIANEWISSYFNNKSDYDLLVTSDYVILTVAETLYNDNKDYEDILAFIDNMIRSSSIKIINIDQEAFTEACRKIKIYHEILQLQFSLTDATTLYNLHSSHIKAILTFNPILHRLEYLLGFDFDPDMNTSDERLYYDAKPDIFNENEIKKNFTILSNEVRPKDAISLFDLELSGWKIVKLKAQNGRIIELKLDYIYENDITYNKRNLPVSIQRLKELNSLDISNNDISNLNKDIVNAISNIKSLKVLDISQNGFLDIPSELLELQKNKCKIKI